MIGGLLKTTSALAILAAAGLIVGGVTLAPKAARAADLGGDCCADLEERVAELEATTARKGNRKISLTISGRVNANMLYWNENAPDATADAILDNPASDSRSDIYFGNHGGSESNFNFSGSGKISKDVTAGFYMEIRNDFGTFQIANQFTDQHGPGLEPRNTYVYLKSTSLGELRLGRTGSASGDGWYEDFGAGTVGGLSGGRFVGNFQVRDASGQFVGPIYGDALGEWTDTGGINRIWYATPTFGGFTAKVSYGGSDTTDASLTWVGKFNTVNVEAGIGYNTNKELEVAVGGGFGVGTKEDQLGGSASIYETGSGLFLSGALGKATTDNALFMDKTFWYVRGGWQKNVTGLGLTSIDAQYYKATNGVTGWNAIDTAAGPTSTANFWGIGIDQAIDSVASNVYLHYQRDTVDPSASIVNDEEKFAVPSQSIDSVTAGMIVRF